MAALLRIRAERDRMSAIERRIADFLLADAHLLGDYSSQQFADALGRRRPQRCSRKPGLRRLQRAPHALDRNLGPMQDLLDA